MNIIVCIKRVPDTTARIEIEKGGPNGIDVIKADLPWVLNPYDEFALEEGIRIREKFGAAVTLLTAGWEGGEEILKKGISMGADAAVYVKDQRLKCVFDGLNIARVLSAVISKMPFDIILCGKQGTDGDFALVGPALSGLLDIPIASAVKKLDIFPGERRAVALRETEGGSEFVECGLPALFTTHKGLNEPRYPTLPGIMKAKKQEIKFFDLDSLGMRPEDLLNGNISRVELSYTSLRRKGAILKGEVREQVKEAIKFLKYEVRVI